MSYALVRVSRKPPRSATPLLRLDDFARATGTHPELIKRLVMLGVLDATEDHLGALWLAPTEAATLARAQRLRAGFALNYAAVGLVTDLLDRIAALEAALRAKGGPTWTPPG
ncbi:MAG TPA: chaperone modulator CbpM [Streptosporangiaceae bacterium]|nr:chaperone modulator CbpM [Streptosporangiaceae bacterium]